jgi:hypothetical protein
MNLPHEVAQQQKPKWISVTHAPGYTRPISYEALKAKGIYVFSYMNGKTYILNKVKPHPSYEWRRLEYLPENIKAFEIVIDYNRKEYKIVVAR